MAMASMADTMLRYRFGRRGFISQDYACADCFRGDENQMLIRNMSIVIGQQCGDVYIVNHCIGRLLDRGVGSIYRYLSLFIDLWSRGWRASASIRDIRYSWMFVDTRGFVFWPRRY